MYVGTFFPCICTCHNVYGPCDAFSSDFAHQPRAAASRCNALLLLFFFGGADVSSSLSPEPRSRPARRTAIVSLNMLATARRAVLGHARHGLPRPSGHSFSLNPAALRRLLSSLAILEQREGQLNPGSLSTITAAKKLGGPVHAFLAGASVKSAGEEAAKVEGVEKIIAVNNAAYEKVRLLSFASVLRGVTVPGIA